MPEHEREFMMEPAPFFSSKLFESQRRCVMQQQISFLDSSFGKMSPTPSTSTKAQTSTPSCKSSSPSTTRSAQFLDLRSVNGVHPVALWETVTALPGGHTTPNFTERPSAAKECTLSAILDQNVPEKYYLSPRGAAGIIRRSHKRSKPLPDILMSALAGVAQKEQQPTE